MTELGSSPSDRSPTWIAGERSLRFMVAVALGAGVTFSLSELVRDGLHVRTDVVGYPIFANFDIRSYFVNYGLLAIVFPVVSLALFHGLTRFSRRRGWADLPPDRSLFPLAPAPEPAQEAIVSRNLLGAATWSLFVGSVYAAGAVIAFGSGRGFRVILVPVTLLYVLGTLLVGAVLARWQRCSLADAVAAVNALGGSLSLIVVLFMSMSAHVTIESTGHVDHHRFLPTVPATAAIVLAGAVVGRRLLKTRPGGWASIERNVILYIVGPVVIFVLVARMPGPLGFIDLFHDGEPVAGYLVAHGRFPWRDILFIHGLTYDVGVHTISEAALGESLWATRAGTGLLLNPLYWIAGYLLCVRLFRENLPFLLGSQLLIVLGAFTVPQIRLVFVPIVLLSLWHLLERASWPRAAAFVTLAVLQAVMSPEAAFVSVAACGIVVIYELAHHRPGTALTTSLTRIRYCAASGAVVVGAFVGYLIANHALGQFIDYYRIFAVGHELSGGVPIAWGSGRSAFYFAFWVVAPVVLIIGTWWFVAAWARARRPFVIADWVMGAAVLGLVPYYTKFLSRADEGHLLQTAGLALVPLLYAGFRVLTAIEARLPRYRLVHHPLCVIVAVGVVGLSPYGPRALLSDVRNEMVATVPTPPSLERVGYQNGFDPTVNPEVIGDLQGLVDSYLTDGGTLFDFTNSPAMFGYFVQIPLATRYFHVSMAIPEIAQKDLVDELTHERPELVVYSSEKGGLGGWDGVINPVRHYLVSDYLLDHYRPFTDVDGYVFMARDDLPLPSGAVAQATGSSASGLYFRGLPCDWGYAPEFLDTGEPEPATWVDVGLHASGDGIQPTHEYRLDAQSHLNDYDWLEVRAKAPFGADRITISDGAGPSHEISFTTLPDRSVVYRVRVGSCPQWKGYDPASLLLRTMQSPELVGVRLGR